jgi:small subunit ribosomal protein S13
MLNIFDKFIPDNKGVLFALTNLYGINKYQSTKICKNIGVNPYIKLNQLNKSQINKLTNYIEKNILIEQDLRKKKLDTNAELLTIKSYRGIRNSMGLPVRGQRTHTNAKTKRKKLW